ncbi:MAG: DUF6177 family protein, partial [Propionibacteriales bacterium]|nr:DUF6177 family protein [Propionibacteriales bacterium]
GGSWTVRTTSGGLYDGFNGARIQTAEDTWTTALPSTPDAIADEFCAAGSSAGVTLISSVRLRHSAREETLLGRPVESWSEGPFGAAPVAWDTHEPIGRRWDRAALTEALREEMPGPATVIVGGPSLSATITAERTDLGVEEEDVIEMGLAGSTADDLGLLRDQQADVLRQLAESAMPVVAVQMIRPGGQELTIPPSLRPPPIPLLLLLGPPTVRELGIDVSAMSDRFGAEQVGRPRLPSLLFTFGSVTEAWDRVAEVLAAIDHRGELSQALFTPSAPEEARHG